MGRDALLAAILSGVLRPGTSSEQSLGFGRAPVSEVDLREGFGENVARLVAGVEHVTCVEETANSILRGSDRDIIGGDSRRGGGAAEGKGSSAAHGKVEEEEEEHGGISHAVLLKTGGKVGGGCSGEDGGVAVGPKGGRLREASALEQVSWQVTSACTHYARISSGIEGAFSRTKMWRSWLGVRLREASAHEPVSLSLLFVVVFRYRSRRVYLAHSFCVLFPVVSWCIPLCVLAPSLVFLFSAMVKSSQHRAAFVTP